MQKDHLVGGDGGWVQAYTDAERFELLFEVMLNPNGPAGDFLANQIMPKTSDELREVLDQLLATKVGAA